MSYEAKNVINGTFGELWINDVKVAECTGFQAKLNLNKEEVKKCGSLGKAEKVTGWEGKGSIKFNKVFSRMARLMAENIKNGKQTVVTIVSNLADPDAFGSERVAIKDATFDELTLADWEAKKILEENVPFSFSDFEFLDMIEVN